ncbi:MAG: diguanylate cyclase [Nitrospirae bacterium]|nr:MAG: diguanylate cyclase [Nitrospirota bacterium]
MSGLIEFYHRLFDSVHEGVYFMDNKKNIMHWNKSAERITGYSEADIIGSRCSGGILTHLDKNGNDICTTDCVFDKAICNCRENVGDVYIRHKDGHRVPVRIHITPVTDPQGNIVGAIEVFRENVFRSVDEELIADLKKADLIDPLTGLANQKYVEMKLRSGLEHKQKHDIPFGIILISVDDLRDIDEIFTHDIEQEVFNMVARTLESSVRSFDLVGRWGEEYFLAVISHVNQEQLVAIANKLRTTIERSFVDVREQFLLKVTLTMGATVSMAEDSVQTITGRVLYILERGKSYGHNLVFTDEDLHETESNN